MNPRMRRRKYQSLAELLLKRLALGSPSLRSGGFTLLPLLPIELDNLPIELGFFTRIKLGGVEIGVAVAGVVVEAFHEFPCVDDGVWRVGLIGAVTVVGAGGGGRAAVDEDERAVGGGGEGERWRCKNICCE